MLRELLFNILRNRELSAVFQPIIGLEDGVIIGYEGLVRGPADTPLHAPTVLLETARAIRMSDELEALCREVLVNAFVRLALPGKLFLNVSPQCLVRGSATQEQIAGFVFAGTLRPERVVIELTEADPVVDVDLLLRVATHYRALGVEIALDDVGAGFSCLRLWSELRPDYVKADLHFANGIEHDPVKGQFMRAIQDIARATDTKVIAEGIETEAALGCIAGLGIACGQGYHIGHPATSPSRRPPAEVVTALARLRDASGVQGRLAGQHSVTARRLLRIVRPATPAMSNSDVFDMFAGSPNLEVVPVVEDGLPVGLITRRNLLGQFATQFIRELHGRKPCTMFMDPKPLTVDQHTPLQELSKSVVEAERHHLFNGFIITADGAYIGMGTGHDLVREITALQISAARYANPLTGLPGNVPLNEHIDHLLANGIRFAACYIDLDHFKPFNDCYGYRKGDDIIQLTGRVLEAHTDPHCDFLGHIGGDDFLILFRSGDWEARCHAILASFAAQVVHHFDAAARQRGGYLGEDRQGHHVLHPLVTVSLGIVKAEPGHYSSHLQIATVASEAKKQAKRVPGNSLFVDRRTGPGVPIPRN